MDIIPKSEKRSIKVELTAVETHNYSIQLANENKKIVATEEEKKAIVSQYAARINESKALINKLSGVVTDGFEMRDIDCEIIYNKPEAGKKTIIRKDTDKVLVVEKMTDWDFNLFNQPEDEETSELLEEERDKLRGGKTTKKKSSRKKR